MKFLTFSVILVNIVCFIKKITDYIQYKCYQYFVRNNIKLNDFDMPDEAKQLFWIEPYFYQQN